ncbi:Nramp family divalent metal transporter [Olivibacter sitiensis]|uniref:Nramp family divalent metal transporter n=1 Tax=Olivibacter sitiensis TaxID=376470 RepID=UPI000401B954|nr:Nramp family divalent metal transporter [Olivibacter sitiensis]
MNTRKEHKSLHDVHESVDVQSKTSKFKRALAFFGPAYLISVGYMDPGNWATDLAGGSRYGYTLIWVLLMSNLMALLLQSLCARLGVVWGKDLAQCNRESYPKGMNFILYLLAELAIAACDLAEVLGMAIGLQLLFGLDLIWGVSISFLDTFLLLYLQRLGMRKMELFIIGIIFMIGMCFLVEMVFAEPDMTGIARGFIPSIPDKTALYISIGIIGATVMPHNLYLHSALVQTRKIKRDEQSIRRALKYNFLDSAIALNLAFFVNAAILILAAAVFHKNGMEDIAELEDAHHLLAPMLGTEWAPRLFAIALILAGQSSTVTGTLAGQIVMEGYLRLRISPVLRRIITRLLAIIPAVLVILLFGEKEVGPLLIFSQVLLSMQLAFAVIPLIHFVSDKHRMGVFVIGWKTKVLSWIIAAIISVLNFQLVYDEIKGWIAESNNTWLHILLLTLGLGLLVLLAFTVIYPLLGNRRKRVMIEVHPPFEKVEEMQANGFRSICVALDYSESDVKALQYAMSMAGQDTLITLIHIVESASTHISQQDTDDYEARHDKERMQKYLDLIHGKGYHVQYALGYKRRVSEIVRITREVGADLIVVGSHGHKGLRDFVYGETVDKLRHRVAIPVFIAQ